MGRSEGPRKGNPERARSGRRRGRPQRTSTVSNVEVIPEHGTREPHGAGRERSAPGRVQGRNEQVGKVRHRSQFSYS